MKEAMPEDFFKRDWDVRHGWEIAQASAAYWGEGAGDRVNCTGIIYTPSPILLTVMMKNIGDMDIMGGVAWRFSHLGEAIGERLHPEEDASSTAPAMSSEAAPAETLSDALATGAVAAQGTDAAPAGASPEVTPDPAVSASVTVTPPPELSPAEPSPVTGPETPLPSSAPQTAVSSAPTAESTPGMQVDPPSASRSPFRFFLIGFLILFVTVVAVAVMLILREQRHRRRRRHRKHRRYDD